MINFIKAYAIQAALLIVPPVIFLAAYWFPGGESSDWRAMFGWTLLAWSVPWAAIVLLMARGKAQAR